MNEIQEMQFKVKVGEKLSCMTLQEKLEWYNGEDEVPPEKIVMHATVNGTPYSVCLNNDVDEYVDEDGYARSNPFSYASFYQGEKEVEAKNYNWTKTTEEVAELFGDWIHRRILNK